MINALQNHYPRQYQTHTIEFFRPETEHTTGGLAQPRYVHILPRTSNETTTSNMPEAARRPANRGNLRRCLRFHQHISRG